MKHQSNSRTTSGAGSSLKHGDRQRPLLSLFLTASFVMSVTHAPRLPARIIVVSASRVMHAARPRKLQKISCDGMDEATNPGAALDRSSSTALSVPADRLALSTPLVEVQKLIASDGASRDFLGDSVAISGDTAIVGDPFDNVGTHVRQGSAVIFVRSGNAWVEQQKIIANDGGENDEFGSSVAVSGDTVVVGAVATTLGVNPARVRLMFRTLRQRLDTATEALPLVTARLMIISGTR